MNTSQALQNLKKSAKQQTEELMSFNKEILEESFKELQKDLKSTTTEKLNLIETNIQRSNRNLIIVSIVSSLIIGIIVGAWGMKEFNPPIMQTKIVEKEKIVKIQDTETINQLLSENQNLTNQLEESRKETSSHKEVITKIAQKSHQQQQTIDGLQKYIKTKILNKE